MPELTITSPYVNSKVDSNTFTMGKPMPESTLTLCQVDFIPQSGTLDSVSVNPFVKKLLVCNSQHLLVDQSITIILLVKNLLTESNYRSGIDPSLKNRTRFGDMSYEQML
jgi:hypothetical protein